MMDEFYKKYMTYALQLAAMGRNAVQSNPLVGAVLVYNDRIIGEGFHRNYGEAHAEVNCINSVKSEYQHLISQSTLFLTLEPCCHFGKTPPCTNFIVDQKIRKVVIGSKDLNPLVSGKGVEFLKLHHIEVVEGILRERCEQLNLFFRYAMKNNSPYIILKWAEDVDGKIGNSQARVAISGPDTNLITSIWRSEVQAIWIGSNTLEIDNPKLINKTALGIHPYRIVSDSSRRTVNEHRLFNTGKNLLVTTHHIKNKRNKVDYLQMDDINDLKTIAEILFEKKIFSILVEGGSQILNSFISQNVFNEIRVIKHHFKKEGLDVLAPRIPSELKVECVIKNQSDTIIKYIKYEE